MTFTQSLAARAREIDAALADLFVTGPAAATPDRLRAAMQHALLGGGKRLRPFLVIESAKLFGCETALQAACAVECVHCYSLAHDDLPAMDNDEMRRGQPTVWKAFDDWTAILAGDGLLTLAFEILAGPTAAIDGSVRAELVAVLARAAGATGMVGGQALDIGWERLAQGEVPDADQIRRLQMLKTGALLTASCEMGGVIGGASGAQRDALRRYGDALGFAFQIADDLLDAEGSAATTGKAVAKDQVLGKATLVALWGAPRCRELLSELEAKCAEALAPFGEAAALLVEAAHFVATRDR